LSHKEGTVEKEKKSAAQEAVRHVRDGFVVGLGSGSTAAYAIEELGNRMRREKLHVLGVPTSYQAFMLAVKHGVQVTTLEEHLRLDLTIDGVDQVDSQLNMIKGMGGALAREKIVASASQQNIIVADENKKVVTLGENGQPVPIEVLPFAVPFVMRKIEEMHGTPVLREGNGKVGPVMSDNGNFIVDADFRLMFRPMEVECALKKLPGVVETGLFIGMADIVYIGKPGGVEKLVRERSST
jgi:ribose 5-phosphate isomerase A